MRKKVSRLFEFLILPLKNISAKYVFACIFFFLLAFAYEALKYYRESMFLKNQQDMRSRAKKVNGEDGSTTMVGLSTREQIFNFMHGSQTLLHGIQVFVSYVLMLIVMLCNNGLIIIIVLGAALGYFVFGWMRKVPCQDSNECCY
jgi:solute carrier family 31 (copper transporter), member 1